MKIAVWHNLPSGGGKRALYDQVRGLLARGHEVEAWCPPTANQDYLPLNELIPEHVVDLGFQSLSELSKINPLRWNPAVRLWAMDRHCQKCAKEINAGGFDLLFSAACLLFATTSIGRFVNIPSVIYLQEPYRWLYECLPDLPWPALAWTVKDWFDAEFCRKALIRRIKLSGIRVQGREERRNAMAFDDILVNSYFSRESVLRAYGLDAKVCYLGVNTHKFVNRRQKRESLAVSIGAFTPEKNAEFVVRALAKVSSEARPELVWIANAIAPAYLEAIRQLARDTQVKFELKFRIEDSEVIDILNRARVMSYAPRLEPFGYAPLEANACGVPVVAVAEGGVRETIQDGVNGILVEHDPESMATAIELIMRDHELFNRLSSNGDQIVRTSWSLPPSIDRLESRLTRTLGRVRAEVSRAESRGDKDLANQDRTAELAARG